MKNTKFRKLILMLVFAALTVSGCNLGKEKVPANAENPSEEDVDIKEATENLPEDNDKEPEETETKELDEEPEEAESENEEIIGKPSKPEESSNQGKGTTSPSKKPNKNNGGNHATGQAGDPYLSDSSLAGKWEELDSIAAAGQTYYTENFSKTRVITKNGYLYNKAAEEEINVRYLVADGYLPSKYVAKECDVLLIDIADIKRYSGVYIKDSEEGLTVVAAMPHPSENMYLLSTAKSAGGAISSSQYAALLNNYYQNHGTIGRLDTISDDYNRILSFVSMYESRYENYYVRSIMADNKYALVTLSVESNPADVRQYILRRSGSIWEVVMNGLENEPRVHISVNKALPDFNLDLLPNYTINDHLSSLSRDKSQLIGEMTSKGYIAGSSDIKYICGTTNFAYIVLDNEIKYICNNIGDNWNIVQVATSDEARSKMVAISKNAPTFIILDR